MDLSIDVADYKLNIRAAAIILHNGKVLLHNDKKLNFYALVGGRIAIGEDSKETLKREILEEMGKEIEIKDYAFTVENFFILNNKKYHEIMFVYTADFKEEADKQLETTIQNIERKNYLQYDWIPLEQLNQYDLKPKEIIPILQKREYPRHLVIKDWMQDFYLAFLFSI